MSTGSSGPFRPRRLLSPTVYIMFLVWMIVIVGAALLYFFTDQQVANQKIADPGRVALAPTASAAPIPNKEEASPFASHRKETHPRGDGQNVATSTPVAPPPPDPEAVAATKMRWVSIKGQIEDIRDKLDPAVADAEGWSALIRQLPENDVGKRIAGSKAHVEQYRALLEQPRQPARLARQYRDTVQVHLETAKKYLGKTDNVTPPTASLTQELDRLQGEVQSLAREYHRDRLALEKIVSDTAAMSPAKLTLEKAVLEREKEVAGEYLAKLTAVKEKAEADAQQKLRDAEEKAIHDKTQAEADRRTRLGALDAQRIRDETDRSISDAMVAKDRAQRDEKAKQLRARAEDPQIQQKYSALLQKGYMTFKSSPGGMQDKGDRPVSASFGDLSSRGWLKNSETFAKAMSRQPNSDYNVFNDRPTHAYPKTAAEWDEMEKLLQQFKTLAPIWVEMGLLER